MLHNVEGRVGFRLIWCDDSPDALRENNTLFGLFEFWGSIGFAILKFPGKFLGELQCSSTYLCYSSYTWPARLSLSLYQVCTTRQTAGWLYRTSSRTTTRCTACRVAPVTSSLSRLLTRQEAATVNQPASKQTVSGSACLRALMNI